MTIGMVDYSPNPDCFARLLQVVKGSSSSSSSSASLCPQARELVAERCSLQVNLPPLPPLSPSPRAFGTAAELFH
jgi:hypothetical protein